MQASAEAALGCSGQGQQLPAFFLRQADVPGGVIVCCQLELLFKAVHGVLHRCAPDKLPQLPSWGKGQAHRHWCTVPADAPQTDIIIEVVVTIHGTDLLHRGSRADGSRRTAGRGGIARDFGVTLNEKFLN